MPRLVYTEAEGRSDDEASMKRIRLPSWHWLWGPVMLLAFSLLIAIVVSCPFNRRSARPPAPPVRWRRGLRKLTSASLPGRERAILISANGARRRSWSGLASSLMNMRQAAG